MNDIEQSAMKILVLLGEQRKTIAKMISTLDEAKKQIDEAKKCLQV